MLASPAKAKKLQQEIFLMMEKSTMQRIPLESSRSCLHTCQRNLPVPSSYLSTAIASGRDVRGSFPTERSPHRSLPSPSMGSRELFPASLDHDTKLFTRKNQIPR